MGEADTDTHREPRRPWESRLALGTEAGSQENKQQDLPPTSPAALWRLLKFTPPWTQPQCPLIPKYSITPLLHPRIDGAGPSLAQLHWLRRGRGEPAVSPTEWPLTHFNSWPPDGSWLPFCSRQALREERWPEVIASAQTEVFAGAQSFWWGLCACHRSVSAGGGQQPCPASACPAAIQKMLSAPAPQDFGILLRATEKDPRPGGSEEFAETQL